MLYKVVSCPLLNPASSLTWSPVLAASLMTPYCFQSYFLHRLGGTIANSGCYTKCFFLTRALKKVCAEMIKRSQMPNLLFLFDSEFKGSILEC